MNFHSWNFHANFFPSSKNILLLLRRKTVLMMFIGSMKNLFQQGVFLKAGKFLMISEIFWNFLFFSYFQDFFNCWKIHQNLQEFLPNFWNLSTKICRGCSKTAFRLKRRGGETTVFYDLCNFYKFLVKRGGSQKFVKIA